MIEIKEVKAYRVDNRIYDSKKEAVRDWAESLLIEVKNRLRTITEGLAHISAGPAVKDDLAKLLKVMKTGTETLAEALTEMEKHFPTEAGSDDENND